MSLPLPPMLAWLQSVADSPAYLEIAIDSPLLSALAAAEPVDGIEFHTFGGTSTIFSRTFARFFTPDSFLPAIPPSVSPFHWRSEALQLGAVFDIILHSPPPIPIANELHMALVALAAVSPEARNGTGDLLVEESRSHLPFSKSRVANALNHAEALWDRGLQAQVIKLLTGLDDTVEVPPVAGLGVAEAAIEVRDAELIPDFNGPTVDAYILNQSPAPGQRVTRHSRVYMVTRKGSIP
jgi:hypothetical protein